mgnify:FL=1
MKLIILTTLFLIPLIGLASFPIENETTEIINEIYNQTSNTKTPWYNTWWAIVLNIISFPTPIWFVAVIGLLLRIIILLSKIKNFWIWFFKILGIAVVALFLIAAIGLGIIGKHGI